MQTRYALGITLAVAMSALIGCKRSGEKVVNTYVSDTSHLIGTKKDETKLTAVVRWYAHRGITKGDFMVLHPINEPERGGIRWLNAPEGEVVKLINEATKIDGDVVGEMNIRFGNMPRDGLDNSGDYEPAQISPLWDPLKAVYSIGEVKLKIVPKINLPPADPWKYGK